MNTYLNALKGEKSLCVIIFLKNKPTNNSLSDDEEQLSKLDHRKEKSKSILQFQIQIKIQNQILASNQNHKSKFDNQSTPLPKSQS